MIHARLHLQDLYRDVQKYDNREGLLRLDMNEYVPNASCELYEELRRNMTPEVFSAYPMVNEAYHAIAKMINRPEEDIVLTAGSDGVLYSTLMAFCEAGDTIAFIEPTYGMYHVYADMMALKKVTINYSLKCPLRKSDILDAINKDTRVFIFANPNGIFGDEIPMEFVEQIIEKAYKTNTVVLIDEVYADFVDMGISRFVALTHKYDNLVIARSFSKGYGLAGVRVGYALSHPNMRKALISVRSNVEINAIAVEAIKVWCNHYDLMARSIQEINDTKKWIGEILTTLGMEHTNGLGNFVLIKVMDEDKWRSIFMKNNVAVKWMEFDGEKWLRVTVGTQSYMEPFVNLLQNL